MSSGDERTLEQIEKQLNKKLDVIKVKTLSQEQCYTRELMLLKVKYNKNNRRDIIEICDIMKTEIVDMSKPVSYTHLDVYKRQAAPYGKNGAGRSDRYL